MQNSHLDETLKQIGNRLYIERHKRREKLETVARAIGVTHPVISRIENGRYKGLSVEMLSKLAGHYGISLKELELPNMS